MMFIVPYGEYAMNSYPKNSFSIDYLLCKIISLSNI